MLTGEELHRRGVEAVNHGRVRLADSLLRRAHARADDAALRARIDVSRAYVAMELGDRDEATRLCEEALARPDLDDEDRGVALSQLAMLHMRAGEAEAALVSFDAGIALLHDRPRDLAQALGNRGDVHLHQGDLAAAVDDFERAARGFDAVGADIDRGKAEHNLGFVFLLQGDVVGALHSMESAYRVVAPVSPVLRAICEQDRAEALLAAGLVTEGTELLGSAVRSYGARRLRRRQGEAELALARRLLLTDPSQSQRFARLARQRFDALDSRGWTVRAEAACLAADVERGRVDRNLVTRGDRIVAELVGLGLGHLATGTRLHLVRAALDAGELDVAAVRLRHVRADRRAPLDVRLLDRDVRAAVARRRGRRRVALAHLRAGLEDLHEWQSSLGSLDLQTMATGQGVRLARTGLRLAVESRSAPVLFEWSERARMLTSRVQPVRAPQDAQTSADLVELRAGPAPEREVELRRRVREQAWTLRGSGEVTGPAALEAVQEGLGPDTALIAHVVSDAGVVALVVTDETVARREIGQRDDLARLLDGLAPDLDVSASSLPDSIAAAVRSGLAARLARLDDLLVAPLVADLGDRQVVLTPSGLLAGIPWNLLPGLAGRPVTVARSATSWLARSAPTSPARVGFVAGPRVARAEAEVLAASRLWDVAVPLVGQQATCAAVSALASQVDLLHVAAHGRHSADNPLFSGLELADGSWYGYDIDQLAAVPQVVLLSACEVGRSSVRHGEELIGMATAWLHAGARWVVASPAAVDDQAAHDTLLALHAGLRAGLDPPAALAAVEHRPDAAPAPFVCFA